MTYFDAIKLYFLVNDYIMLKKVSYSLVFFITLIGFLSYISIEPIDKTTYKELNSYTATNQELKELITNKLLTENSFQAGWAKTNITPENPVSMAGYGLRPEFEGIYDSLFVRTIVIRNQQQAIAIVSMDLLIVHPDIAVKIRQEIQSVMPEIAMIYFTATHTHHGVGGWAKGLIGKLSMGGYEEDVFQLIVNQSVKSIAIANKNCKPAKIGYGQVLIPEYVGHRILPKETPSTVDAWLRLIKIRQNTGKEAVIAVYNAHNNGLEHSYTWLSNDYVGGLLDGLRNKTDFAMFASGMVASHRWTGKGEDYESVRQGGKVIGDSIKKILPTIEVKDIANINFATLPIHVRKPQLRITENYKMSSWLFESLVTKLEAYITLLQIGDIALLGMPCDFSGELFKDIAPITEEKNIKLVITSFNGAYIGYISHDRLYDCNHSEIRDMNWIAPESSTYFTEISRKLLTKCD